MEHDALAAAEAPPGVTPNFDSPTDVLNTINLVAGALTVALITPFVLLRIYIKSLIKHSFEREDWFCLTAWILSIGYCLTGLFMGRYGGGYHSHEVRNNEFEKFKQALYANTIIYGPAAWFTKSTLLLIYIRIFTLYRKTHIFIYLFIAMMLAYYLPVMILKIRICTPITGIWNSSISSSCLDESALFHADTVMSALTDVVVLILPVPLVWKLNIPVVQKLKIVCLLGAGGLATGASIVRLVLVFQANSFDDETVSFVRFNLLGVAEVGIGIICACFPAFGILFSQFTNEYANRRERRNLCDRHGRTRDVSFRKDTLEEGQDNSTSTSNWSQWDPESMRMEHLTIEEEKKFGRSAVDFEPPYFIGTIEERERKPSHGPSVHVL